MSDEGERKGKGGRPRKHPEDGLRVTHATRLKNSIAKKLVTQAEKNHRSISEEIEYIINQSFDSIVVNVDDKTRNNLEKAAYDSKVTIEEEVKRCLKAHQLSTQLVDFAAEFIPAFRAFQKGMEAFRASRIGFVLMIVIDSRFDAISNFLRDKINKEDIINEEDISSKISKHISDIENLFEKKFGLGSVEELTKVTDSMLQQFIIKKSGYNMEKDLSEMSKIGKA